MVRLAAGTGYRMLLEAMPYCAEPGDPQSVAVSLNGTQVADLRFEACARQAFELGLPGSLVGGDVSLLTFRYAQGVSPSQVTGGIGANERPAVGFLSLELKPEHEHNASS
jgi:hypothetical protein